MIKKTAQGTKKRHHTKFFLFIEIRICIFTVLFIVKAGCSIAVEMWQKRRRDAVYRVSKT